LGGFDEDEEKERERYLSPVKEKKLYERMEIRFRRGIQRFSFPFPGLSVDTEGLAGGV